MTQLTLHARYNQLPSHYDDELHESYYELKNQLFDGDFNALLHHVAHMHTLDELKDIAQHGCAGGNSLIYYHETVAFYDRFHDEIWSIIYDESESYGQNCMEFIASFNGAKHVGSDEQFKNLLAWYAIEYCAHLFINDIENR